jgi:hypothetical protein
LKNSRDCPFRKAQATARLDASAVSQDEGNFAQEVASGHRRITLWNRVTLGLNGRIFQLAGLCYNAVGNQAATIAEDDDIAFDCEIATGALDHERVPGPNHRKHAPSGDAQAQAARRVQYFARQLALEGVQVAPCSLRKTVHDALA